MSAVGLKVAQLVVGGVFDPTALMSSNPAYGLLKDVALTSLATVLVVLLTRELYKFVNGGTPNFVGPVVRCGIAVIAIQGAPLIGKGINDLSSEIYDAVVTRNGGQTGLFVRALEQADALNMTCFDAAQGNANNTELGFFDFDFGAILSGLDFIIASIALQLSMLFAELARICILDIAYPVTFNLILFFGTIAIPLGLISGGDAVSGWLKQLLSVAMWPVMFGLLLTLMTTLAANEMQDIALHLSDFDCASYLTQNEYLAPNAPVGGDVMLATVAQQNSEWFARVSKLTAVSLFYSFILFATPWLSGALLGRLMADGVGSWFSTKTSGAGKTVGAAGLGATRAAANVAGGAVGRAAGRAAGSTARAYGADAGIALGRGWDKVKGTFSRKKERDDGSGE